MLPQWQLKKKTIMQPKPCNAGPRLSDTSYVSAYCSILIAYAYHLLLASDSYIYHYDILCLLNKSCE